VLPLLLARTLDAVLATLLGANGPVEDSLFVSA